VCRCLLFARQFCGLTVFFSTLENALFYPFYVLKTREQADCRTAPSLSKSPWSASRAHLRVLLTDQGVKGLYRGFVSSNLTAFPAYGVYMGVYSWAKAELGYRVGSDATGGLSSLYAPFLAGLLADAASVALYVPGDVVVQRLQLKDSPYSGFLDACRQIYSTDGLPGFFRGFTATFVTSGIASAVWWVLYENVKKEMYDAMERRDERRKAIMTLPATGPSASTSSSSAAPSIDDSTPSLYAQLTSVNRVPQLLAGFIAGTFTSVLINPLDVVKTRLQVQDTYGQQAHDAAMKAPSSPVPPRAHSKHPEARKKYRSMTHGLKRIYLDEGLKGYWRGLMPKIVSRGPLSAMSSLLYEVVMHLSKSDEAKRAEHRFQPVA
jgi:hypothetical protein